MDSGTYSYGLDVEGSDCFETVSRLFRDCFEIAEWIVARLFSDRFDTISRAFGNAARRYALNQGFCTSLSLFIAS